MFLSFRIVAIPSVESGLDVKKAKGQKGATITQQGKDPTSFGWAGTKEVYIAGANHSGESGWSGFTQGQCLYFRFCNNRLSMCSVTKDRIFTIDNVSVTEPYIHFNFFDNTTKLALSPLSEDEHEAFMSKLG